MAAPCPIKACCNTASNSCIDCLGKLPGTFTLTDSQWGPVTMTLTSPGIWTGLNTGVGPVTGYATCVSPSHSSVTTTIGYQLSCATVGGVSHLNIAVSGYNATDGFGPAAFANGAGTCAVLSNIGSGATVLISSLDCATPNFSGTATAHFAPWYTSNPTFTASP